jgi:hypothetical protein
MPASQSQRSLALAASCWLSEVLVAGRGGTANRVIAERLGICEDMARRWRRRYCEQGIGGLADAPRPGRLRTFPAWVAAWVKALACTLPPEAGSRCVAAGGRAPQPMEPFRKEHAGLYQLRLLSPGAAPSTTIRGRKID